MKTIKKFSMLLALTLSLCMAATGCSRLNEAIITTYVEGNIKAVYLGEFTEVYMKIVDNTEESLEQAYLEGVEDVNVIYYP